MPPPRETKASQGHNTTLKPAPKQGPPVSSKKGHHTAHHTMAINTTPFAGMQTIWSTSRTEPIQVSRLSLSLELIHGFHALFVFDISISTFVVTVETESPHSLPSSSSTYPHMAYFFLRDSAWAVRDEKVPEHPRKGEPPKPGPPESGTIIIHSCHSLDRLLHAQQSPPHQPRPIKSDSAPSKG